MTFPAPLDDLRAARRARLAIGDGRLPAERPFARFGSAEGLPHLPALDGLRGAAVVGVLLFHGGFGWASGGFLGVSLFFTLSGFLITSLLLDEHRRTGRIALGAFWSRRFRRLLPAAWLTLGVTTLLAIVLGEFSSSDRLDVWASLANVANWRFLAGGGSYSALFAEPSPVRHFWSLAIEEQFYVVLPLVVALVMFAARRRRLVLGWVLGGLTLLSVLATALSSTTDRVYYGTDTRAAEILLGALLAVGVSVPSLRRRLVVGFWPRTAVQAAGALATGASLALWATIEVTDPFVSGGGLVLVAGLSVCLVLNAAMGIGPIADVLSSAPLRYLGRISYGLYLFHWPLLVLFDQRRIGLGHTPRVILVLILSVALADLSYRRFERPFRLRTLRLGTLDTRRVAPIAAGALVVVTLLGAGSASADAGFDADAAKARLDRIADRAATERAAADRAGGRAPDARVEGATASRSTPAPDPTPSFAFFGDSVALSIAYPMGSWAVDSGAARFVGGEAELGCGIGRGGYQRAYGETLRTARCDDWEARWGAFIDTHRPDIAMVQSAQWEIVPRKLPGDGRWRVIGDPVYDEYLKREFTAAVDTLSKHGALVIWVTQPHYGRLEEDGLPAPMRESHDPARVDRLNQIIRDVAATRPDTMRVVDLAAWMEPRIDDAGLRHDGSHFNDGGGRPMADGYLGPEMVRTWRRWRAGG